MSRVIVLVLLSIVGCLTTLSYAQYAEDAPRPFEVYGLASGLKTVDATGTLVVVNPGRNSPLGFTPSGLASGARAGFVWRHEKVGLVADLGLHKYSERIGSTLLAPLMVGVRVYSDEHYRTSFFGEGLAGAYRWNVSSGNVNFTTDKGIVLAGGGMDIRLTRRLVWRVFEFQIGLAGARNGPLSTGGPSTGIAYRFGGR